MGIIDAFKRGLKKTHESFFEKIARITRRKRLDDELLEELEELLITADIGVETTEYILERLKEENREDTFEALREIILDILKGDNKLTVPKSRPFVISVVGVNGSGKTTTCAKLAKMLIDEGKRVVLSASDTFRAAAVEQLRAWAEKVGADIIAHSEGADPGAVAFDAVKHAKARGKDVVIIDTAGRLHTKKPLMEELRKIHRVVKKVVEDAPHETLLVIDATTGQNALMQAEIFKEAVDVTGIVVTKLDGTAKGGIVLAISRELGVPIKFVGVGEGMNDLKPFDPEAFVEALLEVE